MPDYTLPEDEDRDRKENPFEEFINRDLGMESMHPSDAPDDDSDDTGVYFSRHFSPLTDDDDNDPSQPFGRLPGGFSSRFSPGAPDSGALNRFSSSSPFNRSPFGGGSGSLRPPSGRLLGSLNARPPAPQPPPRPTTRWEDIRAHIRKALAEEIVFMLVLFAGLLVIASVFLYVDNLRLSIALRDGQIQELRALVEELQRQLTPLPGTE